MMLYIWLTFLPCINKSDDDDDVITIGVWDGGGDVFFLGGGGAAAPPIFGNSDFWGQQEKFGQSQFLRKFPNFFIISKR